MKKRRGEERGGGGIPLLNLTQLQMLLTKEALGLQQNHSFVIFIHFLMPLSVRTHKSITLVKVRQ